MFTRVTITAALLAAGTLFAEEKLDFTKPEAWGGAVAKQAKSENGTLVVPQKSLMTSAQSFTVDPAKTYELSLQVKSTTKEKVWVLAGFMCYDKKGRCIYSHNDAAVSGTDTVLLENVKKGDTVLKVKNASRWGKQTHYAIAFNTKPDYSDLPNFDVVSIPAKEIKKSGDSWTVTLAKPMQKNVAAGTAIRQMANGGYVYTAGYSKPADQFVTLKGSIKGIAKVGYPYHVFPAGTVKTKVMILSNWGGAKTGAVYKDITLVIK